MYKTKISDYESKFHSAESKQREVTRDVTDLKQRIDTLTKENNRLKDELNEEKNRVKSNKREFGKQLKEHQKASEKYLSTTREKDAVIEDLKSKRSALETEVEKLRREWEKLKADYKKVSVVCLTFRGMNLLLLSRLREQICRYCLFFYADAICRLCQRVFSHPSYVWIMMGTPDVNRLERHQLIKNI